MIIREAVSTDIPALIDLLYQVGEVHHQIRPDIFPAGQYWGEYPHFPGLEHDLLYLSPVHPRPGSADQHTPNDPGTYC